MRCSRIPGGAGPVRGGGRPEREPSCRRPSSSWRRNCSRRSCAGCTGYRLEPAASYVIDAKVLSKRRYRRDALARIAPWDFALGWGPLSDEPSAALVSVTQGDRLMFWHLLDRRVPQRIVERSTANVHLIPANDAVLQQLDSIVTGAVVRLSGTLVNLYDLASRQRTATSLNREDTGLGACEILYVKAVELLAPRSPLST
jgi:hypothetical protein